MKRVVVNIQSLVLKGFRFEDRHAVAQGLQEQLSRLLAEPGMAERLASLGHVARLPAGSVSVAPEVKAQLVGIVTANVIEKRLLR